MKLKVSGFRDNSRTQRDSSSMQIPRETHVTVTNVFFGGQVLIKGNDGTLIYRTREPTWWFIVVRNLVS